MFKKQAHAPQLGNEGTPRHVVVGVVPVQVLLALGGHFVGGRTRLGDSVGVFCIPVVDVADIPINK